MQILFKFHVNWMKIDDFRNFTKLLTFGLSWPFDLKTNRLFAYDQLYSTILWSFVKIGLKMWPVGDWYTNRQTGWQTNRQNHRLDQPIHLWITDFASNKHTNTGAWIIVRIDIHRYARVMFVPGFFWLKADALCDFDLKNNMLPAGH